jgi:hypothetical protein
VAAQPVRLGEVELAADGRQSDVDDREIRDGDEVGHHQQGEGSPALARSLGVLHVFLLLDVQPIVAYVDSDVQAMVAHPFMTRYRRLQFEEGVSDGRPGD